MEVFLLLNSDSKRTRPLCALCSQVDDVVRETMTIR